MSINHLTALDLTYLCSYFYSKFPIDTQYELIKVFRMALEAFVKDRPREWVTLMAFRAKEVAVDRGYVEYIASAQHREAWQSMRACLDSRAELASFALELAKKMGIRYHSPPMPVDLTISSGASNLSSLQIPPPLAEPGESTQPQLQYDFDSVAAMFVKDK
jgi:hypothetical protein